MGQNEYLGPREHSLAEETTLGCELSQGPIMGVRKVGWRLAPNLCDDYYQWRKWMHKSQPRVTNCEWQNIREILG